MSVSPAEIPALEVVQSEDIEVNENRIESELTRDGEEAGEESKELYFWFGFSIAAVFGVLSLIVILISRDLPRWASRRQGYLYGSALAFFIQTIAFFALFLVFFFKQRQFVEIGS